MFSMGKEMQTFPRTAEQFTIVRKVLKMRYARRWR
jgi:hypothetical protein